tara:strand:- start:135 stop:548 length:414 start_codon:yes stop_codon:yes gene_type:complete
MLSTVYYGITLINKEKAIMKNLALNAKVDIEIIFTFDGKDQQMWHTTMKVIPLDMKESEWIRSLIQLAFANDMHEANDLVKISMCIGCKAKGYQNIPMIKDYLSRNGKYYFQPDQRDEVEEEIIKGTAIASKSRPYN